MERGWDLLSAVTILVQLSSVDKALKGECVRCVGFLQDAYTVCPDLPKGKVNMLVSRLIRELLGFHALCDQIIYFKRFLNCMCAMNIINLDLISD